MPRSAARREPELALIYQVGQHITQLQSLSELLPRLVHTVSEAFGYSSMGVLLVEDGGRELVVSATIGLERERHLGFRVPVGDGPASGIVGYVAHTGEPLLVPDVARAGRYIKTVEETRAELAVPLKLKGRVIGVIDVQSVTPGGLDESDSVVLTTLADQVAIAVENARLYEELARAHAEIRAQAGQLQRLLRRTMHVQEEERRRIAADIHDSAVQLIYGALYETEGSLQRLPPDAAPLRASLQQARGLLNQATAEIYKTIFDLWPTSLDEAGLLPAVRSSLLRFEQSSGIQARLVVEGRPPEFAPWAQISLFRIIQEALHNVRKHAAARSAQVGLACDDERVTLTVQDDGAGFDAAAAAAGDHLGLVSMRERAFSLGGTFAVETAPGRGARLVMAFARAQLEERPR